MNIKGIAFLTVLILILAAAGAGAHRLYIDWGIGKINIESFYGGSGKPCQDGVVRIYTSDGELLQEGKTDNNGKYSFSPLIGVKEYKVIIESTHLPGHRAEQIVNLETANSFKEKEGELPLFPKIIAGLGYLMGIAGISLAYMSWKEKRKK